MTLEISPLTDDTVRLQDMLRIRQRITYPRVKIFFASLTIVNMICAAVVITYKNRALLKRVVLTENPHGVKKSARKMVTHSCAVHHARTKRARKDGDYVRETPAICPLELRILRRRKANRRILVVRQEPLVCVAVICF